MGDGGGVIGKTEAHRNSPMKRREGERKQGKNREEGKERPAE